jgi:hypothetical protein
MKRIAQVISFGALAGTLLPACLFFAGRLTLPRVKLWLLVAAALWFLATPLWMERKSR